MEELTREDLAGYLLSGNVTVRVVRGNTDSHYSYNVRRCNYKTQYFESDALNNTYFVTLVSDGGKEQDTYVGHYYYLDGSFYVANRWKDRPSVAWPAYVRTARLVFRKLYNKPDNIHIYKEDNNER